MTNATITETVRASLDRFSAVWTAEGGRRLGDHFSGDASLINPFGQRADGREAIAAMYAQFFTGLLAGTSSRIELLTARPIDDLNVFIDATQTISAPDGTPVLVVHLAGLMTAAEDGWLFVDSRPYMYAAPPA